MNLPFGTQGRSRRLNEAYFLPKRNSGDRKTFVPKSPTMSCLASVGLGTNPERRERVLQLSLACGFMLKSAEARSGDQTVVVCGWVGKEFPDLRQSERRIKVY